MPYVPPVNFVNNTPLTSANMEANLAAAHAFVENGIVIGDVTQGWVAKENICSPSYYGYLNTSNLVSGVQFHQQIKSQIVTGAGCPETPFAGLGFRCHSDTTLMVTWDLTTSSASDAGLPAPGNTRIELYLDGQIYGYAPGYPVEETPAGLNSVCVRRNLSGFALYQKIPAGWHYIELRGVSSTVRACVALEGNLMGQGWTE